MSVSTQSVPRKTIFQQAIYRFITERRDAKLKSASADTAADAAKYVPDVWLQDAARRVAQIQAVTHVPKATHPDARGTALHRQAAQLAPHSGIVGTHSLGSGQADDVVGNAAALDVYKFLKTEVEGQRLLDWLLADDADAIAALHDDPATAQGMAEAFKGLIRTADTQPASHALAKQVYWCIDGDPADDANYHLLQPMFSSSLAHAIHVSVQEARFGEANAMARKARRDNAPHAQTCVDYRALVVRKQGGSKPQNISQLTSERGGVNYLLGGLPPQWGTTQPRALLGIDSSLPRLTSSEEVRHLLKALVALLSSDPARNQQTREKRGLIEEALGAELAAYGAQVQASLAPGWTRDAGCKLARCEQLWLDSARVAQIESTPEAERSPDDAAFVQDFHAGDWPDEVATRFAQWVNAHLRKAGLPVGDDEARHWARQAVVHASWPVPLQRRAKVQQPEVAHG